MKIQLTTQFLARPPTEADPSKTPIIINITFPVNNSDPARITIIKPTGNTAPNTNFSKPKGAPALIIPALVTIANKPPNAIYAPAKKESNTTLIILAESFAPAVFDIAFAVSTGLLNELILSTSYSLYKLIFIILKESTYRDVF